jgi:isopentenyl diphosphate isomerase/L-lactate dehydrogenase-like FMN-dependent dehydrogenase
MSTPAFGDYQLEIYGGGLRGVLPAFPMAFAELEARAAQALPPSVLSYVAGGAGSEHTQRANVSAFRRWGLMPRMFVGAARRDLSVALFGMRLPSPLFMAPIGVLGLCAQDGHGDLATATAAARTGVPMIASTLSVDPMEDVAARFGGTPGFFQLYTPTDRDLAASLVARAEAAGLKGIVVTLDTWLTGWRPRDLATSNFPQLRGVDGIYCSNHGGRQADGGLAALDCLPDVVEAAGGLPVLFDSGVRSGADVIKALALGATAVGIGRSYAYGLAIGGTDGVVHVLRSILAEADLIMAVDGYPTLADLTPDALRRTCDHD